MTNLTDRQRQLLKAIVELYVKTGEPISSELVEKTYDLGVSPATIRNEMVRLTDLGYIRQPHTSAGRIPTAMGFRLYINELMQEKDLPIVDEVVLRQQVLDQKVEFDRMLQAATKALSKKVNTLALSIHGNDIYYCGAAYILDFPEFVDIDVTRFILSMFDDTFLIRQILQKAQGPDPLHIIFGEETGYEYLQPTSFAFLNYQLGQDHQGIIGVVGPARLNFPVVIPYLRYIGNLLMEANRV